MVLKMSSQEYRELVVKEAGEHAKSVIMDCFDSSENFWEGMAKLKKRNEQIKSYNMMKKVILQIQKDCEHDFRQILAFEQYAEDKFVYLKRCPKCYTQRIWENENELSE